MKTQIKRPASFKKVVAVSFGIFFCLPISFSAQVFAADCDFWETRPAKIFHKRRGNISIIPDCLKSGKDPNYIHKRDGPLLIYAAKRSTPEGVKFLLDAGADPNVQFKGTTALKEVLIYNTMSSGEITRLLLAAGADPNLHQPIVRTGMLNQEKSFRALIEAGANINSHDQHGLTVLHFAVRNSSAPFVKQLIELGAEVNATDMAGNTTLHHAARSIPTHPEDGGDTTLKLLFEAKPDVNTSNKKGQTPLHLAVWPWKTDSPLRKKLINYLTSHGADISARDKNGWSPLEIANHNGHQDIVELLVGSLRRLAVADARQRDENRPADSYCLFSCDPLEKEGREALEEQLNGMFKTPVIITKFRKINGISGEQSGTPTYEMHYEANVELPMGFTADRGSGVAGILSNVNALGDAMKLQNVMNYSHLAEKEGRKWSDPASLLGKAKIMFRKSEKGWIASSLKP